MFHVEQLQAAPASHPHQERRCSTWNASCRRDRQGYIGPGRGGSERSPGDRVWANRGLTTAAGCLSPGEIRRRSPVVTTRLGPRQHPFHGEHRRMPVRRPSPSSRPCPPRARHRPWLSLEPFHVEPREGSARAHRSHRGDHRRDRARVSPVRTLGVGHRTVDLPGSLSGRCHAWSPVPRGTTNCCTPTVPVDPWRQTAGVATHQRRNPPADGRRRCSALAELFHVEPTAVRCTPIPGDPDEVDDPKLRIVAGAVLPTDFAQLSQRCTLARPRRRSSRLRRHHGTVPQGHGHSKVSPAIACVPATTPERSDRAAPSPTGRVGGSGQRQSVGSRRHRCTAPAGPLT